ncbi:hypothetical protein [Botrimarina mediterranea]|uniref:Uncharacterized protein n=1 Tax=Botrimarina mediterranea TaxID=2528022 RepID=A0A518KC32_9BACT|nr:hypothetical protein [Botrimarina mediterranea]QDV75335.1 hypothetical protein Spa11_35500 [Botrimarina mediterranea]QDV80004.1 hypothetical protein K2D_36250 [Planctomycetes bacterium K2D]
MRTDQSLLARLVATCAALVVIVSSMGASCSPRLGSPFGISGPPAPVVLSPTSSAAEVVAAINANASRIQTYQAPSASISMPQSAGLPLVSASIAVERPQRFRMRATTGVSGPELDLGSNDERFWIWARRNDPPALYTARHDQWATSPMKGQVPIEPAWLIDALGLVQLDPTAAYVGPLPRDNNTIELRAQTANGVRVLIVDAQTAWVREQHVYDNAGALTASVVADNFRYDQTTQTSLPERVRVNVPAAGLDLTINAGQIVINAPVGDGGQLWSLPQLGSYPVVDLIAPGGVQGATKGPWDLSGTGSVYGQPGSLVESYASTTPVASQATAPITTAPTTRAPNTPSQRPSVYPSPATAQVAPVTLPQASGFVGLPAGGRALE